MFKSNLIAANRTGNFRHIGPYIIYCSIQVLR